MGASIPPVRLASPVLPVVLWPHKALSAKCQPVEVNAFYKDLAREMVRTMKAYGGIGLACNQLGEQYLHQIVVLDVGDGAEIYFNPRIVQSHGGFAGMREGCLSIPGAVATVKRFNNADVEYIDVNGEKKSIQATGVRAHVLQHEIDHLGGMSMMDHVDAKTRSKFRVELMRLKAKGAKLTVRYNPDATNFKETA
jgi:peptide deformylase